MSLFRSVKTGASIGLHYGNHRKIRLSGFACLKEP